MGVVFVIILVAAVVVVVMLSGAIRLATLKLLSGDIRAIAGNVIPAECVEDLVQAGQFLHRNGFVFHSHVHRGATISGQEWGLYGAVYFHEANNTWALAYVEPIQHAIFPWRVCFLTPCTENQIVCTISGGEFSHVTMPAPFTFYDSLVYAPQGQLHFHQDKINGAVQSTSPRFNLLQALDAFEFTHFQGLVESSLLVKWGDGYRLPLRHALQVAKRYQYAIRELTKQKAAQDGAGSGVATTPKRPSLASDIRSYQTYRAIKESNTMGSLAKTGILLISVLFFGVSFGLSLSLDTVLILVVVLLVHEAGHLFGMWLLGYKDLSMLFVPFVGALANGRKEQVKAWQETVILLLGPVPGYIIGVLIITGAFGDVPEWAYQFGLMALILNLFNLLPFMPLDGGKICNLALFSRMPRVQVAFMFVSILAFFFLGIVWDLYAILVVAALLAMGMPFLMREAYLLKAILQQKRNRPLRSIEDLMKALEGIPAWSGLPQAQRWPLLDSLQYKVQHHASGIRASMFILVLWVFSVIGPPYLSVSAASRTQLMSVAATMLGYSSELATVEELRERYRTADNNEEKADLAYQLANRLYLQGFAEAETYIEDMKSIADSADLLPDVRGDLYSRIAGMCELYEQNCAIDYFERAADTYRTHPASAIRALLPLHNLASMSDQPYHRRMHYLDGLETVIEKTEQHSPWLPMSYSLRAQIEYEHADYEAVEHWLLAGIEAAEKYSDEASYHRKALVNFYYEQGHLNKAIDAAQHWADVHKPSVHAVGTLADNPQYVLAWLYSGVEPGRAKTYLDGMQGHSPTEKLELLLAQRLVDSQLAAENVQSRMFDHAALIGEVEGEEGWYWLSYRILETTSEHMDVDNTFAARQLLLDRYWYERIAKLLEQPEFSAIKERIYNTYHQSIDEFQ